MAGGEAVKLAIGIGCRAEASAQAVARMVRRALAVVPAEAGTQGPDDRLALWAPDFLAHTALEEAAASLGLPLHRCDPAALRAVGQGVVSHSVRVAALHGVGSVAEAAALVGAGAGARVIVPKFSADGVSVAAARGEA